MCIKNQHPLNLNHTTTSINTSSIPFAPSVPLVSDHDFLLPAARMKFDFVGVVGLGFLGRGIAASLLSAGLRVIAVEKQQNAMVEARRYIETAISEIISHGGMSSPEPVPWAERYSASSSLADLKCCPFVIESVTEDLAIKRRVFDELETIVDADVPIASNTSALPITLLQQARKHPSRFLGMHWSEPAYATRFLEIIRGDHTSDTAIDAAVELGRIAEKEPCIVRQDIPGFIANRLGYAMYREAANLLELGIADVETIDRAFCNAFGPWAALCGPFRWIDITGGPELYAKAMTGVLPTLSGLPEVPSSFREKREQGERGTINGRGFYTYQDGDAERWRKVQHEHAWEIRRLQDQYHPLRNDNEAK
jgi:3-hydroxybutyryl-CoA dehydrogenase